MIRSKRIKITVLLLCKALGLFWLARKITGKKYRILCWHGFSHEDEHLFRPKLFVTTTTLEKRLAYLKKVGFAVQPMSEIVKNCKARSLADLSLAITIDDGWSGLKQLAQPVFRKYQYPWTLYLTTYQVEHSVQVGDVAIQYALWKSKLPTIDLIGLVSGESEALPIVSAQDEQRAFERIYALFLKLPNVTQQQQFINQLAEKLEVDWAPLIASHRLYLSAKEELAELYREGVDIQLHTHTHFLPKESKEALSEELRTNDRIIQQITGKTANQLCYPSGEYCRESLGWLKELGIQIGLTCHSGLNDADTDQLLLHRFLDSEDIAQIEFEAEMSGFKYLMRNALGKSKNYR